MAKNKFDAEKREADIQRQQRALNRSQGVSNYSNSNKGGYHVVEASNGKKFLRDNYTRTSDGKKDWSNMKRPLDQRYGKQTKRSEPFIHVCDDFENDDGKARQMGRVRHYKDGDVVVYNPVGKTRKAFLENANGFYFMPDFSEPDRYPNGDLKTFSSYHRGKNDGYIEAMMDQQRLYKLDQDNPNYRKNKGGITMNDYYNSLDNSSYYDPDDWGRY